MITYPVLNKLEYHPMVISHNLSYGLGLDLLVLKLLHISTDFNCLDYQHQCSMHKRVESFEAMLL